MNAVTVEQLDSLIGKPYIAILKLIDTRLLITGAPVVVPDFIGQIYIKTDATVAVYIATGVATSGDWKSV